MIVMPGFIDTHRHIWEGILKNIAPDALLDEYFRDILGVLAPVYRPQDAYAGNLVSALGAIDCGVTTLLDWSHIQNTPEHTDAAISALQESGLRSVFAYGTPNLDMAAWWHDSRLTHPTDVKRVATQYFSSPDQLLTLALAPRGPEFTTFDVARHDWDLAREADIILLRTDRINVLPINDPIGVVVRGMDSSNVDSVFIAGKARKRRGQLLDVDLARVKRLAYESRDYVVAKSGFKMPAI